MATKKRKPSPAEREYQKQLRRIKRFIKSAEKRGFIFDQKVIPPKPKRITKASVQRLRKITPTYLYKKAVYTTDTLDIIPAEERRKQERQEAAKKAARTRKQQRNYPSIDTSGITQPHRPPSIVDSVLTSIEELIDRFPDGYDWHEWQYKQHEKHLNVLKRVLYGQIQTYGRTVVAMRLQKAGQDVVQMAERIIYGDSKDEAFQADLAWFAQILKGDNLTAEEALEIQELASLYEE